jgi:WD40 repeat protein
MRILILIIFFCFLANTRSGAQYYLNGKRAFSETGHQVYTVSYNKDGNYIVSVGYDRNIIVWNAESGVIYRTISGLKKRPLAAAIHADTILASGGDDNVVILWNLKAVNVIRTFEGIQGNVKTLDISPDGKYLAAGGDGRLIKVWEIESGKVILELKGHKDDINVLKFSSDGSLLASGGADRTLIIWNITNGSIARTISSHKNWISDIDFSPDGKYLASCGYDKLINIINLADFSVQRTLKEHTDYVQTIDFSPDGKFLLSGGRDKIIILWDINTGEILSKSEKQDQYVLSVDFCPVREDFVSSAMMSENIQIWAFSGATYAIRQDATKLAAMADKQAAPVQKPLEPSAADLPAPASPGKNYALLIGINDYESYDIPDLDNPLKDARSVYEILTSKYTFNQEDIILLENPKRKDFITTFENLAKKISSRDNLLIFYAGHGVWDKENRLGYWFPADAEKGSSLNWFSNTTLRDFIGSIRASHILLIADACFSGAIFKTRNVDMDAPQSIKKLDALPSRRAMTSGILEEVPDESVFVKYLVKRLSDNEEKFLTSELLYTSFKMTVIDNGITVPMFGVIQNVGDEGGDFIFTLK